MDIDENPFSYFLESPSIDDDDDVDLSAGIEGSSTAPRPEVREVSPSSLMEKRDEKLEAEEGRRLKRERARVREEILQAEEETNSTGRWLGIGVPLSLRDFTSSQSKKRRALGPPSSAAVQRGRGVIRLTPTHRGNGCVRSRSLSGPRRRSWREPSPEIVSIPEEGENHAIINDYNYGREQTPDLLSDNGLSEMDEYQEPEVVRKKAKVQKEKKKVRWAMPERWDIEDL